MKSINFLFILILVFLFSCSREVVETTESQAGSLFSLNQAAMQHFMTEVDFKHDFIGKSPYDNGVKPPMNKAMTPHIITASSNNQQKLSDGYNDIKKVIVAYHKEADWKANALNIERISLQYLRNYFLLQNSEDARKEAKFLLFTVIKTKSIDLDVLADAYQFTKSILTDDEKETCLNFILHQMQMMESRLETDFFKYKEIYEEGNEEEKRKALLTGKRLENKSKSIQYTKEILSIAD